MKLISVFLFLLLSSSFCIAQNEELLIDEHGKFIYYELVEVKGVTKNQLTERANSFLRKELKLKTVQGDTVFIANGKLIINKTVLVMSHPSGEILYHFQAEVKEGKYRFWLTDFNFVPYQRDRYGNFVATSSKGVPLETNPGKLNAAQWKEYQTQTAKYAQHFSEEFKDYMLNKQIAKLSNEKKKVVGKDW